MGAASVGDLRPEDITPAVLAKFHARHTKGAPGECWNWTGARVSGYGRLNHTTNYVEHRWLAHRIAWVVAYQRTLPALFVVDHLCCNRLCVNPAHLEAVTQAENIQRGHVRRNGPPLTPEEKRERQAARWRAWWVRNGEARKEARRKPPRPPKTHCVHGHEYTPENTYVNPSTGGRSCRKCGSRRSLEYYYAHRTMRPAGGAS